MGLSELQAENQELREQMRLIEQRRLTELETRLEQALSSAEHFKAEAYRNAEIGRKIATEAQTEIALLREKINTANQLETHRARFEVKK